MNKFYCNICGKDVFLNNGKCPNCNTNWEKIITKKTNGEGEIVIEDYYQEDDLITNEDIDKNINFFITWAKIIKFNFFIFSIVSFYLSFYLIEKTEGMSLLFLIPSFMLILWAFIFENCLKWKAYMLYTNQKRNRN